MGQKQGSLANHEMGVDNPSKGENEGASRESKPPSENPSGVLTSTIPDGAENASTEVDEGHSQGALEPDLSKTPSANERGHESMDDGEELKASTASKTDPHAKSEPNEKTMQTEQRQMTDPNGEMRIPSECENVCEDKNLETQLPPTTNSESSDSSQFSMSMDANNDSSKSMKVQGNYQIPSRDEDCPTSSTAKQEQSSDGPRHRSFQSGELFGNFGSETQYPPTQVMERPADTASPSSYRIPSHVFARDPTSRAEWSVASNESLFSIRMGNMSFSNDINWLGKYDEMDKLGETSMPSPQPNMSGDFSSNQSLPLQMENRISLSPPQLDDGPTATEERAAETMREVIRENTENSKIGTHRPTLSHQSQGSTKSFVFPILTDVERNGSSVIFPAKQMTEVEAPPQAHVEIPKDTQQHKETSDEPKQSNSSITASINRFFSCFSCCALGQGRKS